MHRKEVVDGEGGRGGSGRRHGDVPATTKDYWPNDLHSSENGTPTDWLEQRKGLEAHRRREIDGGGATGARWPAARKTVSRGHVRLGLGLQAGAKEAQGSCGEAGETAW